MLSRLSLASLCKVITVVTLSPVGSSIALPTIMLFLDIFHIVREKFLRPLSPIDA